MLSNHISKRKYLYRTVSSISHLMEAHCWYSIKFRYFPFWKSFPKTLIKIDCYEVFLYSSYLLAFVYRKKIAIIANSHVFVNLNLGFLRVVFSGGLFKKELI